MSKIKEVIIILALAVVLCLAAEFLAGYLIYSAQVISVENEFTEMANYHASSSAASFSYASNVVFGDMKSSTDKELAEKYDGYAGTYDSRSWVGKLTFEGQASEFELSNAANASITAGEKNISCYPLDEILDNKDKTNYMVMSQRKEDGFNYSVVLQPAAGFYASVAKNYFDFTALVSQNSRVCASDNESITGKYFSTYLQGLDTSSINWIKNFTPRAVSIEGTKFFVSCKILDYSNETLGVVGLTDYSGIDAVLSETLSNTILIVVMFSVFILLVVVGLTVYLLYKKQHKMSTREVGRANYNVTVSSTGEIVRCSRNFKKFTKVNIFDAVINKDLEMSFSMGSNLVCYLDDHGKERIVSFVIVDKDQKLNFRMVGVEIAEGKALEYRKEIESDFALRHSFKNRYVKATSMDSYKVMTGIIEITNIKKLQTMFGPKVASDVVAATDDRIKKFAETVYPLDMQNKAILITKEKEVDFFQNDIKAFFSELNKPVNSGDMLVDVNVNGGLVLVDKFTSDKSYDYMMKCAQAALKRVHAGGGPKYYIFHDSVKKQYIKFFDYDFDITQMLDADDFEMQYQPQYSVKQKKVIAFEALFRVKEHLGLQIDIGRLIDYIQYEGQIGIIGKFTFDNCLRFAKEIEGKGIKLSVNVSPLQFMQVGFVSAFAEMVKQFEVEPTMIDIEITETFLVGNIEEAANKIKELKKYGIGVHLDDFGKEYSSLNYLYKMPVEAVKIDRDFVIGITQSEKNRTLVQSIIDMVHKLGIETIAEGVETEDQFNLLKEMGCDLIQGYYIGKSMTEKRVIEMLNGKQSKNEEQGKGEAK